MVIIVCVNIYDSYKIFVKLNEQKKYSTGWMGGLVEIKQFKGLLTALDKTGYLSRSDAGAKKKKKK